MAVTVKQTEMLPESYPDAPESLSTAAAALDPSFIWQRLESFTAVRWTARNVVWIVEGPGEWCPPLSPASVTTVEVWSGSAWETITADSSPLGYWLPAFGPYRFTASVGGGDVPANVTEAFRRLAEYMSAKPGKSGARSESIRAGSIELSYTRSPSWLADAMHSSGAADLLRTYRRG
jgi:hypothetical protein